MSQQDHSCDHMIASVHAFLRAHPGIAFTEEELCQQIGCTPVQTRIALNVLLQEELIQKERSVSGSDRYIWGMT